jgi:hypothetical protein
MNAREKYKQARSETGISTEHQGVENMKIHRIDHVGIIVNDLPAAKVFFLDFSLEVQV